MLLGIKDTAINSAKSQKATPLAFSSSDTKGPFNFWMFVERNSELKKKDGYDGSMFEKLRLITSNLNAWGWIVD